MTSAPLIDWKVFNVTDATYLTNLTMRTNAVFTFIFFNATVLCKRNENELRRNSAKFANFHEQIANFRFRRKFGEISAHLLF